MAGHSRRADGSSEQTASKRSKNSALPTHGAVILFFLFTADAGNARAREKQSASLV